MDSSSSSGQVDGWTGEWPADRFLYLLVAFLPAASSFVDHLGDREGGVEREEWH